VTVIKLNQFDAILPNTLVLLKILSLLKADILELILLRTYLTMMHRIDHGHCALDFLHHFYRATHMHNAVMLSCGVCLSIC